VAGSACYLFHSGFLLGLFFDPESLGDLILCEAGLLLPDYTVLRPRRHNCSYAAMWESQILHNLEKAEIIHENL
jgi:hypothetical protein